MPKPHRLRKPGSCTVPDSNIRRYSLHEVYESHFVTRLGKRGRDQLLALLNKVMDCD